MNKPSQIHIFLMFSDDTIANQLLIKEFLYLSDQYNHTRVQKMTDFLPKQPSADAINERLLTFVRKQIPVLEELLSCDPNQLFNIIKKMNTLPQEVWNAQNDLQQSKLDQIRREINVRFRKTTEWNVDHLELFRSILILHKSFPLHIQTLYKINILHKIENGLQYAYILEILEELSIKSDKRQNATNQQIKAYVNSLQESFQATSLQLSHLFEHSSIYFKRHNCLGKQQQTLYRLKLIHLIQNSYEAVVVRKSQSCITDINQELQHLDAWIIEHEKIQFFQQLIKISCPLTKQYENSIYNAKISFIDEKEHKVTLQSIEKLKGKFITKNVVQSLLKRYEYAASALSLNNVAVLDGKIYLKFGIAQLGQSKNIRQKGNTSPIVIKWSPQELKQIFYQTLTNFSLIMKVIKTGENCYSYENSGFAQILPQRNIDLILFCLRIVLKIKNMNLFRQFKNTVVQIFNSAKLVDLIAEVLEFIEKEKSSQRSHIFLLICELLEYSNAQNIAEMQKLPQFLHYFVISLNVVVESRKNKYFIQIQACLINFITKLPNIEAILQSINLQKLYQLKYRSVFKQFNTKYRMDTFIDAFPDSSSYLTQRLQQDLIGEINRFQSIDINIWNHSRLLTFIIRSVRLEQAYFSHKLKQLLWFILLKYPCIFYNNSRHLKRAIFKDFFSTKKQAISFELNRRYEQFMSVFAKQEDKSVQSINQDCKLMRDLNIICSLEILMQIKDNPFDSEDMHKLINIIIYSTQYFSNNIDLIFKSLIKGVNSQEGNRKNRIYASYQQINNILDRLIDISREIIQQLLGNNCSLLKLCSLFFVALKKSKRKHFIYKLMSLFQYLLTKFCDQYQYHLGFQLFNHHQQIIHQAFLNIYSQIGSFHPDTVIQSVNLSDTIFKIVQSCLKSNADPIVEYENQLCKAIETCSNKIIETILVPDVGKCLFNNRLYSGWQNTRKIHKTVICDWMTRMTQTLQIGILQYCYEVVMFSKPTEQKDSDIYENEIDLFVEVINKPILIKSQDDYKKKMTLNYMSILEKTYKYKYNKKFLKTLQEMYIIILKNLQQNLQCKHPDQLIIKGIIQEMEQLGRDFNANIEMLIVQSSWVSKIQNNFGIFSLENYLNAQFVIVCMKLAATIKQDPQKYKQQLQQFLPVLAKFIPRTILEQNRIKTIAFTLRLLQIISNILNLQNCDNQGYQIASQIKLKKINQQTILNLFEAVVNLKCPQLFQQLHKLIFLEVMRDQPIRELLKDAIDRQSAYAVMQADIKGVFLKQHQNNNQSSREISISLPVFVKTFQEKYQKDAVAFSDISKKLLRKSKTKNPQGICLLYKTSLDFSYCQSRNTDFILYQPPNQMKLFIKNLLKIHRDIVNAKLINILTYLKNLFYNCQLLIPYVLFHPIQTQSDKTVSFIDFLLTFSEQPRQEEQPRQQISDFLFYSCLDHRLPVKIKNKQVFFSSLICVKIMIHIIKVGINDFYLNLISLLIKINRFASLCKLKLSRNDDRCLMDAINVYTNMFTEKGLITVDHQNQTIQIYACIYKQLEINGCLQNIKPSKLPAYFYKENFVFQDECLRDYVVQQQQQNTSIQTIDDFYSFTENFIKPAQRQQIFLEDMYESVEFDYKTSAEQLTQITPFSQQNISQTQGKALAIIVDSYQLQNLNDSSIKQNKANGQQYNLEVKLSTYAQQDFCYQIMSKSQFLRAFSSFQEINADRTFQPFSEGIIEEKVARINQKLLEIEKQPLSVSQFSSSSQFQQIEWLLNKQSEVEFDYNKFKLPPDEFDQYLLANSMKLERLKSKRKEQLQLTEEIMFTSHIARNFSTNSISYMIDTIDQNYQHFSGLDRRKSDNSFFEQDQDKDQKKTQLKIEESCLSNIMFPDVREEVIVQLIFSLYFKNQGVRWQFMPFLENKKIQSRLVTTLLYITKNPFKSDLFSGCTSNQAEYFHRQLIKSIGDEIIQEQEQIRLKKRILLIFGLVKEYSYYRTDSFLSEEISNEGFFGTKYELEGQRNTYVPIFQIIKLSIKYAIRVCPIFMENVKGLPESVISLFNNFVANNNWDEEEDQIDEDQQILCNRMGPIDQYSPFACFQEIYSSQAFKKKFHQQYIQKDKSPLFILPYLVQSNIYSPFDLKTLQLKLLASGNESDASLMFINKAMNAYLQDQIREISWLQQYKEIIRKVFTLITQKRIEATKQPIYRLVKCDNSLNIELKALLFKAELKQLVAYSRKQVSKIRCKKEKGIFESAFEDLRYKPSNFWFQRFDVKFVDSKDREYSGHGNGVFREWFTLLSKAMVNLNYALFSRTPKNYYFFSRESYVNPRHLQYYEFIGKLFAFALTDDNLFISPSFSLLLYKLLLSQEITIEDVLLQFEEEAEYVRGLQQMIDNVKSNEDILAADLAFTYLDKRLMSSANYSLLSDKQGKEAIGKKVELLCTKEEVIMELHNEEDKQTLPAATKVIKVTDIIELKAGGAEMQVNIDNMHQYLALTKQKILELVVGSVKKQFQAFKQGFKQVINLKLLKRFNSKELKLLIEGMNEICIDDIQKYTNCKNVDLTVAEHLWSTLKGLKAEDRALFLWNWTGVDKMPAEGAKVMKLGISLAKGKFIVAHTCFKDLQIPKYETRQQMETAVLIVINNVKSGQAIIED